MSLDKASRVCVGRFTGPFQLAVSDVARQGSRECVGLCAKLFQLSLDKAHVSVLFISARLFELSLDTDERECIGLFVQDSFSCRLTRMNVSVLNLSVLV